MYSGEFKECQKLSKHCFCHCQTKWSCSPFTESLRLSFSPDRTFWAIFSSVGRLLKDRIRRSLLPRVLFDWLVFCFPICPTCSLNVEATALTPSSETVLFTSARGAVWLSGVYAVLFCGTGVSCNWQWVFIGISGSGEELRLLSALLDTSPSLLPELSSSRDWEPALCNCAPAESWLWYFTGCLLKWALDWVCNWLSAACSKCTWGDAVTLIARTRRDQNQTLTTISWAKPFVFIIKDYT